MLRETVRELAADKIAPAAAEVDETGRFPQEALDALTGAGLHAVHIPEAYGGEGADALAAVIVIEGSGWSRPGRRSPSPGHCRTATSSPPPRWPPGWGYPRCWARPAGRGTWRWR